MTGTCKPNKQEHKSSDPLALEQFLSAFLLLMAGILLAALLLLLEHVYFRYLRSHLAASSAGSCCALVSLSMGTFHFYYVYYLYTLYIIYTYNIFT